MFATVTLTTPLAETPAFRARLASARPSASHVGHAESLTVDEQEFCPVTKAKLGSMGKPITVQLASRKVWVCCSGCPEKLKAQPAKYLEGMESQPAEGVLSVPETAVIDTGDRKIVYVEAQPGVFEGRQVVLGPRIGERFPVLEGLAANEKVAAAGAFLIDAETRLNQGAAATSEPAPQSADRSTSSAPATGVTHRH